MTIVIKETNGRDKIKKRRCKVLEKNLLERIIKCKNNPLFHEVYFIKIYISFMGFEKCINISTVKIINVMNVRAILNKAETNTKMNLNAI